ncbi:MAG: STAS domain-containing protein [Acidobacteria bacterium]|nr:STAS domain-containing protein [Acidobacteriota bacterium]
MKITKSSKAGVTFIEVEGTVKLGESAQQFAAALQDVFDDTGDGVVIDFSGIDYLDSTGIGELVGYLQKFTKANRRVALFRPHQRLEALLKLTRLDTIFHVFSERDAAAHFVRGDA